MKSSRDDASRDDASRLPRRPAVKARKLLTLGMRVLVVRPRVLLTTWPRSVPAKGHGIQAKKLKLR